MLFRTHYKHKDAPKYLQKQINKQKTKMFAFQLFASKLQSCCNLHTYSTCSDSQSALSHGVKTITWNININNTVKLVEDKLQVHMSLS